MRRCRCLLRLRRAVSTALFVAWAFGPLVFWGLMDRTGLLPLPEGDWRS